MATKNETEKLNPAATHPSRCTHALFPSETDLPRFIEGPIAMINVARNEGGRRVFVPEDFDPLTLTSLAHVAAKYGGGDYEFWARAADGRILAKQQTFVGGAPLPLFAPASSPAATPTTYGAPPPAAAVAPAIGGADAMVQLMVAQMGQTTQLLTALLTSKGSDQSQDWIERDRERDRAHQLQVTQMLIGEKKREQDEKVDVLSVLKTGMEMAGERASGDGNNKLMEKAIEIFGPKLAEKLFEDELEKEERLEKLRKKRDLREARDRDGRGQPRQVTAAAPANDDATDDAGDDAGDDSKKKAGAA